MKIRKSVEKALRERIKELNCLYGMAKLSERNPDLEDFLRRLADFLPRSWQYSGDACVRIMFQKKTFKSKQYRRTKWSQAEPIFMHGKEVGNVAVFYLREKPAADEGPFLREERKLLEAIAGRIGEIAARSLLERDLMRTNKELIQERKALEEANTTLRSVLSAIEIEKNHIQKNMRDNITKLVMPMLNALMPSLSRDQQKFLGIIKKNLEQVVLPQTLAMDKFNTLTLIELNVCNMIRSGLRTKEIAQFRRVSESTIQRQRESIRRKLRISNRPVNLANYLQALTDSTETEKI